MNWRRAIRCQNLLGSYLLTSLGSGIICGLWFRSLSSRSFPEGNMNILYQYREVPEISWPLVIILENNWLPLKSDTSLPLIGSLTPGRLPVVDRTRSNEVLRARCSNPNPVSSPLQHHQRMQASSPTMYYTM